MNRIFVITPFLEQRDVLLQRLGEFLAHLQGVKVLGRGRNGITVSVPSDYDLSKNLPRDASANCHIEEAEAPVLMKAVGPKMRI